MGGSWGNVAIFALAPIPLAWIGGFILFYFYRAQVAGFRAVVPWGNLSRTKRTFVGVLAVSAVAGILMGAIAVMNLYVDTRVPVALGPSASVIKTGPDMVTAEGTWTRAAVTPADEMAYPLQTSHISCDRQAQRCSEAMALVSGNVLTSELIEYEIESWNASVITFRSGGLCTEEVFTIDLQTEAVSGAGHYVNLESVSCKRMAAGKAQQWSYRLASGFPIYWEQRRRARPIPLRVVQALFAN